MAHISEIAVQHANSHRRVAGRGPGAYTTARATETEGAQRGGIRQVVEGRQVGQYEARLCRRTVASSSGRRGQQLIGLAGQQQVDIAAKDPPIAIVAAQLVVPGVGGVVHRHFRELTRCPGHGTVSGAGRYPLQAPAGIGVRVVDYLVSDDGRGVTAGDVNHEFRIDRAIAQQAPRRLRFTQCRVVDQVPPCAYFLFQCAPVLDAGPAIGVVIGVFMKRQQFGQPREPTHDVDDAIRSSGEVEQAQLGLRRIEAGQPAHGFV